MEITKYLPFKKRSKWLFILLLLVIVIVTYLLASRYFTAIWYDEFLITTRVDENRNPVDSITEAEYGIGEVICFMSIRGMGSFQIPVAWYHEDILLTTDLITFGEAKKGQSHLLKNKERDPLPPGNYRCEWGPIGEPVHVLNLEILPPKPS